VADKLKIGEPFDPRPDVCHFYAADVIDRQRESDGGLALTDGQKRLYRQLYRLALGNGSCYASAGWLADALGKSERQVRSDRGALARAGLIRYRRHGQKPPTYQFLLHPSFERNRQPTAGLGGDSNRQPTAGLKPKTTGRIAHPNRQPLTSQPAGYGTSNRQPTATKPEELIINPTEPDSSRAYCSGRDSGVSEKGRADDETEKTVEELEQRVHALMRERHNGNVNSYEFLEYAHVKLDPYGLSLADFLVLDAKKTTRPGGLKNPEGH